MRSIHRTLALAALAATFTLHPARADEMAPKPAPEVARLTAMAGTFEGSGTFTTGGKANAIQGRHEIKVIAGGFGIQVHETIESQAMGHYESENIIGTDPGTGRTHTYTIDNAADVHDHAGTWVDPKTLKMRHTGVRDGKPFIEDVTLRLEKDAYTLAWSSTLAGKPHEKGELAMHRVMMSNR